MKGNKVGDNAATRETSLGDKAAAATRSSRETSIFVEKETGQHTVLSADSSLPSCATAYKTTALSKDWPSVPERERFVLLHCHGFKKNHCHHQLPTKQQNHPDSPAGWHVSPRLAVRSLGK